MEGHSNTHSAADPGPSTTFDAAHLRRRSSGPEICAEVQDKVEDEVGLGLHFSDPYWDFEAEAETPTMSIFTNGIETQHRSKPSNTGVRDDTDLQISDLPIPDAKADFSSETTQVRDSPYPEVRAAVANTDDPTMIVNTFRVWFIGLVFALIFPAFNSLILLRSPYVTIDPLVAQVAAFPFGKLLEWALPKYRLTIFGCSMSLNPGPFNIKEHTLIAIMANISIIGTIVADIAGYMRIIYGVVWSIGELFFLAVPIQLLGFSFAGILRRFLVWPSSMIWPGVLVQCALLNAIHSSYGEKDAKLISRERFLYITSTCSFMYYWLPGYIWTGLSVFNWVCWISPNDIIVNSLFGSISGLGMGLFTFDWVAVSMIGSPLVAPWWTQVNMTVGFVSVIWLLCPILWAKNIFFSQFMPMSVPLPFDNTGAQYNFSAIVTNGTFDQAKYEQYSPMFLPITYAVTYGAIFAMYPAVIVHTFLWYRHDIIRQLRRGLNDETDIQAYLMRSYPEVSHWWFMALGAICCILGIIAIEVCHIGLPIWAFFFAITFVVIFILPFGIVQAISNQQLYLGVMVELILGYILPGNPIANKAFSAIAGTIDLALLFSSDQKFGHYLKVPPRLVLTCQLVASTVGIFSSLIAQDWALRNIPDICSPHQKDHFTCPNLNVYNTAAFIWGGIGPARFFSPGGIYNSLVWGFLIGAVLPIPFYFLARRYPRSAWRYVHIPLALLAAGQVPPATGINYTAWIMVGFVFQFFMRRFHLVWWMRYNYILSAGLNFGVYLALVVIFFAVQLPNGGIELNWWGNMVWQRTADAQMVPLKKLAPGQTFGPSSWS